MIGRKREKSNSNNDIFKSREKRILWIAVAAVFLLLAVIVLWLAVRTRADEGVGHGWQEHHLDERDIPAYASDQSAVWRPCPWDGAESGPVTDESQAPSAEETAAESHRGEGETAQVNPRDEMIYHSRHNDRMEIALSFDDGPHPRLTPVILSILEEYGIKATFFMVGENVGYYPAAARAVAEAGHEIGNHTFSHRKFDRLGVEDLRREIFSCEEAIAAVSDVPIRFIRPPEGQMSDSMRQVIGELDYRVILWDVDTRDWAHTPPETISRHILDTVQAGDIILMHDFIGYNSPTPEALRLVIPALLARGFRFVTVGELVEAE